MAKLASLEKGAWPDVSMPLLVGMGDGALRKRFSVTRQLCITKDLMHTRCHYDVKSLVDAYLAIQPEERVDYDISELSLVGDGISGEE